jgi:RND family efflux transporter MFP subunit
VDGLSEDVVEAEGEGLGEVSAATSPPETSGGVWATIAVSLVLVVATGAGTYAIFSTQPEATKEGAVRRSAAVVEVAPAEVGTFHPKIEAVGTVMASRDVVVRPQVAGRVAAVAEGFVPGGFVAKGDVLVRLEGADYKNVLAQREGALAEVEAELELEEGRARAARTEYEYLGEELPADRRAVMLREPQKRALEARAASARAAIDQARLDLRRVTVRAPFDAHVLRRDVHVGSQVSPADTLGRLVGVGTHWIAIEVPRAKLRWLEVPAPGELGAEVTVRNERAWPPGATRKARVFKRVGELDPQTRMATVLAEVSDPMSREDPGAPALLVGEFVQVEVAGRPIEGARLDRAHLRSGDVVWLMRDGALHIQPVEVAYEDAGHVYVTGGVEAGDMVVTTDLSAPVEGARLRLEGEAGDGG